MIFGQASNHFESTQKVHKKSPRVPSAFDFCIKLEHQRGIRRDRGQFVKKVVSEKRGNSPFGRILRVLPSNQELFNETFSSFVILAELTTF